MFCNLSDRLDSLLSPPPAGERGGKSEARDAKECMHTVQAMKKKKRCMFVSSVGRNWRTTDSQRKRKRGKKSS